MAENAIEVLKVTKKFGDAIVLHSVEVSFEAGKIHGIIGRNGSGKTVLFKCICGFLPYESGSISVYGERIGKDIEMPRKYGCIIEHPGFLPQYSGYRNLKFLADLTKSIDKKGVKTALSIVGLDPDSKKHVKKYSLGMRQRLGIAQAIMEDAPLLILDEPFSGLDKKGLQEMRSLFLEYKARGKTVLIASHNSEDIDILCDTVHEIEGGVLSKC